MQTKRDGVTAQLAKKPHQLTACARHPTVHQKSWHHKNELQHPEQSPTKRAKAPERLGRCCIWAAPPTRVSTYKRSTRSNSSWPHGTLSTLHPACKINCTSSFSLSRFSLARCRCTVDSLSERSCSAHWCWSTCCPSC